MAIAVKNVIITYNNFAEDPKDRNYDKEVIMARKTIDEAVRQKVIEAHKSGLTMRTIAKEVGVSLSSVSRIVNQKDEEKGQKGKTKKGEKTERQKKIEDIEKRIAELEKKVYKIEDN